YPTAFMVVSPSADSGERIRGHRTTIGRHLMKKTAALKSRDPRRSRLHFASIPRSSAEQIWSRRLVKSRRLRSYAPHATTCRQLMTSLRRLVPSANALFVFEAAARYLSFT